MWFWSSPGAFRICTAYLPTVPLLEGHVLIFGPKFAAVQQQILVVKWDKENKKQDMSRFFASGRLVGMVQDKECINTIISTA